MNKKQNRRTGGYSTYFTRNGKRYYAADYGLKAFRFSVRRKGISK